MSKVDLVSRSWCELVFEGRNKEYGAYRLRARSGARNRYAILCLIGGIVVIMAIIMIKSGIDAYRKSHGIVEEQVTEFAQLKKEEPKKEEKKIEVEKEKPQEIQQVKVAASIQFTVPKIEDDALVDETKVIDQKKAFDAKAAIASLNYEGDGEGGINIDELKEGQQAGGTTVPPKEEEITDNALVEQPAEYPGGESALIAFLQQNTKYPAIAQEQELQGVVVLRFQVNKDGTIGQVRVSRSLSKECDEEAMKAVKKLKRFTPARSNGKPVPVWFTAPVRFQIQ